MMKCTELKARQLKDFKSLDENARVQLLQSSKAISIPKGSIVFKENQTLSKLYCIRQGACKFSILDNNGQEQILRFLGEGEVMGKRSLITNKGAKVSATALTDTILCCIDKREIIENLNTNTNFCNDLMAAFVDDMNTNEHTRSIFYSCKGIKSRLASLLLYLGEKFGMNAEGKLHLKVKREDMAAVLGTSPEYIINLLKNFKSKKLIKTVKREIYIMSKSGLEKIN
ncbi:Crp/Fnr family transcriptional regulator [uncultured Croceitalea sp.]|uniref:Crp/Fnr family transcriptional regulator n=1 Tax=uncultured Croceitalea sp. TaxID=1798908 RepID=UPI003305FAEC